MFKINRKIEYALLSLKHMSQKESDALTSAKEICDQFKTPFDPTSRVLQIMTQHGVLKAEQGAKGGYKILKPLSELSLFELSVMIDGPIRVVSCINGEANSCDLVDCCQIISPMANLNDRLINLFKETKIEELLQQSHSAEDRIRSRVSVSSAQITNERGSYE